MTGLNSAVVFGGAGFIGTHLLSNLTQTENSKFISVDIREPRVRVPGVTYIKHDVRDLRGLQIGTDADCIFNLAAVHTTPGHPTHEYYGTNVQGATEITAFARRHSIRTIVFTSSISVYGPGEDTKSETVPVAPESAYGWSKWLAEGIHRSWLAEDDERKLVICRPAVIFGRGEGGNFTRLAKLLKKGIFVYPGRKDTIKACFYVEDLVNALLFALSREDKYILFNGCYPDRYTLEQIVSSLRERHFPQARTVMLPRGAVTAVASLLRPLSTLGLGIHPDRVTKLVRSTDVIPGWLASQGQAASGRIASALDRWAADSNGAFE